MASIGIEDGQYIYKNKYFDTQKMSWRTILPLLLFSVTDIVKETSVIEPTQGTEKTAFLSSLLLLIYGKEFANIDPKTKKEIRVARKKAVEEYVNKKIVAISEKKKTLEEQLALFDGIDVEEKMQEIIDSIKATEEKISAATSTSKEILGQILELQEQAAECNLLQGRYATLRGQYVSDIKRLSFIVNGEVEMKNVTHNTICPFCDGTIPVKNKKSYIKSAQAELHRITSQMNGLVETEKELLAEKEDIAAQLKQLETQRDDIEKIIQEELQPQANSLKKMHDDYRVYIQIQHELSVIADFATSWETDLRELPSEEESESEYHPTYKVLTSLEYGVPQMRQRVYFVGIRKDLGKNIGEFQWPEPVEKPSLSNFLIDDNIASTERLDILSYYLKNPTNNGKYTVDDIKEMEGKIIDTRMNDLRIYDGRCPTLRAQRDGVLYVKNHTIYQLTGYEALLLQGFPKEYADRVKNEVSDRHLLMQAGNAMTVNVIKALGCSIKNFIESEAH